MLTVVLVRSPCQNLPPAGKDELAGAAPTERNGTSTPTFAMSHIPTPALATASAIALYLNNKLFKYFIKAYLEAQV